MFVSTRYSLKSLAIGLFVFGVCDVSAHAARTPSTAFESTAHETDVLETAALLRSKNWQERVQAVRSLARLHRADALADALTDRHRLVRRAACEALGPLLSAAKPAIAQLAAAMSDADREVRAAAALALGWTRIRSQASIAALQRGLHDSFSYVRSHAATSLGELRGTEADAATTQALVGSLDDSSPFVRDAAARSLSWIVRDQPALAAPIYTALQSRDWRVRAAACRIFDRAVTSWSRGARNVAARALRAATHDTYFRVREAARLALASIARSRLFRD